VRIISGQWRGRRLISPDTNQTRPTADRVKESVFNILQTRLQDASILDCFSGTGNLGLEALSRGAKHAHLIEQNKQAKQIIEQNCEQFKAKERSTIIQGDFFDVIQQLNKNNVVFDVIFVDPPYEQGLQQKTLKVLSESNCVIKETIIVVEHKTTTQLPQNAGELIKKQTRKYGMTSVSFYIKEGMSENE
jgi:16S rRNA (guanine966-N2)-methyltransferase